ncbi:TPA: type II toxin-antitoxin system RelE/ParE family toxin [Streptococcus suis]
MIEYPVRLTKQTSDDLTAIYRFIAIELQSPLTADKNIHLFEQSIKSLSTFPERCPILEGFESEGIVIRKLIVKNYVIFYRFVGEVVTVLRVLHGTSNIDALLRDIAEDNDVN